MAKELKEKVVKIVHNPKREEGLLFLIFNNPNFGALCMSLLPKYIREIKFFVDGLYISLIVTFYYPAVNLVLFTSCG